MADDEDKSSKTEEPTERKLKKARDQGNVTKSREVNNLFALVGMAVVVALTLPMGMESFLSMYGGIISESGSIRVTDTYSFQNVMSFLTQKSFIALMPTLLVLLVFGYLGGFVQTGPMASTEPIKPKLSKISLIKGFGRLFSLKAVAEFFKSVVKLLVVGAVIYSILFWHDFELLTMADKSLIDIATGTQQLILRMLAGAIAVAAILAVVDWLFQRSQFIKEQRMSLKEIKDEMKDTEGDPHVKARQRQLRQERAQQRMMQEVPNADVVITNPTHYSVALKYDSEGGQAAPKVVAKGVDHLAMKIREIAKDSNIPFYEDPPLARQLYSDVEIDQEIPLELYEAVAKVIAYIYSIKKRKRA